MTEPSKQAWALARKVSWPHLAGQDITWLAAALQPLMDERDGANAGYCEPLEQMRQRAEAAEADAALAWRRVTELQARGTELVLERRASGEKLAELVRELRVCIEAYRDANESGDLWTLEPILNKYEAKS